MATTTYQQHRPVPYIHPLPITTMNINKSILIKRVY